MPGGEAPAAERVTDLLLAWRAGDPEALDRLVPRVYQDLRRLARQQLRRERPDLSLQATALVHEAYLRLIDYRRVRVEDRSHFLALAAQAMRRILIESARRRGADKRGGGVPRVPLEEVVDLAAAQARELVNLDEALEELARFDPRKARVIELRYFGGLTLDETAHALDVAVATVERDWKTARIWLKRRLDDGAAP